MELLQPDSRGDIRLASADPAEPPVIDPGYLTAESDLRGLVAGLRIAERLCDTAALRPYIGAPMAPWPGKVDDAKLATFIREHAQTAYHPVGTCRMGSDDAAVVDCELRVRGLDGLRVVDASVMPRIIRGHTHAPTVMIAERAADLIRASNHEPEPGRARHRLTASPPAETFLPDHSGSCQSHARTTSRLPPGWRWRCGMRSQRSRSGPDWLARCSDRDRHRTGGGGRDRLAQNSSTTSGATP